MTFLIKWSVCSLEIHYNDHKNNAQANKPMVTPNTAQLRQRERESIKFVSDVASNSFLFLCLAPFSVFKVDCYWFEAGSGTLLLEWFESVETHPVKGSA